MQLVNLLRQVKIENKGVQNLILSLISIALFSIPWCGGASFFLLFAFVPLLIIADRVNKKKLVGWSSVVITFWTIITTSGVGYATVWGVVASVAVSLVLFNTPFLLYGVVKERAPRVLSYTIFVTSWIALEYLYLYNEEISHPWLILGNGFAESVKMIQWYEYSGTLGGTLWVLIVSILTYESIIKRCVKRIITTLIVVIIPITISFFIYFGYDEKIDPVSVTVVQPNIDPYEDKFGGMTNYEQDALIQSLMEEAPKNINYIVAPETSISDNVDIDRTMNSRSVRSYSDIMRNKFPKSELIIGASMYKFYGSAASAPTVTARRSGNNYYDAINGSLQISGDNKDNQTYIKSRLVIGVEMLPFPNLFKKINIGGVNLGGMSGALTKQEEREVFGSTLSGREVKIIPSICYESIYGEYMTGFVRNGADLIFIVTNDGWWRDTYVHRQHFAYARLRAIELRRSVARSANTGISGFINQRGDVVKSLGWNKRGILTEDININKDITFYAKAGDWIGRISSYILILSLLYFIAYINKKRSHLN